MERSINRVYVYIFLVSNESFPFFFNPPTTEPSVPVPGSFWPHWHIFRVVRLSDRLTWDLEEIFTSGCVFIARTTDHFNIWCFFLLFSFLFFFYQPKDEKHKENRISKCCHFFKFRYFAVSVVHAIAILMLIEMHFGLLVSDDQVDISPKAT